ncbi:conjugal transfer protein TraG [Paremcibacter congregatus]|uniref:Conjugal transfer protein TraG n=1 Tax=Paremcibacter congregatus TaxID=2043170 RepID=A0A2G4YT83_9PROT|nr:conjugal transfer protein TraG [Paremcibacter congregatus]PHZ84018.1 conjugal transfer protein TraG [Paremcibacter congregatus]PHZ85460.1 conjugal transfer protein TraG [Paremcibacter congregatus]QDE26281.1 conjugal transfer protein TraG [Paremcibacter congregatus]QDE28012.1 conjugal transfer protein TraG [Paremcibacter congregatus]
MTPTKILIGQMLITFLVVIGTLWAASQWAAFMLGYQARLGVPWFSIFDYPVYYPWRLFEWWYAFEVYAPAVFYKAGGLAAAGGIMGTFVAIIGSLWRAREQSRVTTYGSARWADKSDIRQAGLLKPKGVFLGQYDGGYLRHDGPEHIMTFAPTRSGKGVGLVIPTLLSWTGSVVVHDLKGENWQLTSGWRSTFSHCLCFNPTDISSVHCNPLMEVRRGLNEVRDVQNIADILVDPEGSLERHNHWEKTSHSLLVGTILHVLYAEEEKTLSRVAEVLSDPAKSFKNTLKDMLITNHLGDYQNPKPHPVVAVTARELLNKSENERSGVLSTALSFLSLYRDPVVKEVTSKSDFTVMDLIKAEKPVSLYLVVPPSDLSRTKPLMRLILNQIGRRLTEKLEAKAGESRQLLLMLDEFPALGRLDFFETSLAFMAGYGIRAFLIAQSLNQISKAYGENNSILDNCHVRVAFATNDERTAKRISDSLGAATELRSQKNYAGHRLSPWLGHVMVSRQETARQLLTPGEVMQLPMDEELVQIAGLPPIRAQKLRYYEDQNFTTRIHPPAATLITEAISENTSDWQDCQADVDARLVTPDDQNNGMARLTSEGSIEHVPILTPEQETPVPSIDIFEVIDPDVDETSLEADKYQLNSFQRAAAFDDEADLPLDLGDGR